MTGQKSIIELRMHGQMPTECWVMLLDARPDYPHAWSHPEFAMENDFGCEVHVMPDDVVQTLDFRFLRGIVTHISGGPKDRSLATLQRIAQFEPAKAIAAGPDWMMGWKADRGFVDFLQRNEVSA